MKDQNKKSARPHKIRLTILSAALVFCAQCMAMTVPSTEIVAGEPETITEKEPTLKTHSSERTPPIQPAKEGKRKEGKRKKGSETKVIDSHFNLEKPSN